VTGKPRLLMVGRTRYRLPLDESLRLKFDALSRVFDVRVLATGVAGAPKEDALFSLAGPWRPRGLDGAFYFATLPARVARELRRSRPDAVLVQGAHETWLALLGRRLARVRAPIVLDVHGDWRSATRLYGSPARRLLNPLADRLAVSALRRADAVRTISDYTTGLVRALGVEPASVFPAFMDLEPFLGPVRPLPDPPRALFVGVLEHYKGIDELAAAWRLAAPRLPGVTLHLVGRGTRRHVVEALRRELPAQTEWTGSLPTAGVAAALDAATALVLPSRSEGMGRVLVEAFCRGRPAVASRVGGIVDLVRDGENGLLVTPPDPPALADALVRLLSDPALAGRLAAGARATADDWVATPDEYAARLAALVAGLVSVQ
jgi:glycosyltransferase involved in cell wall biosynthesis